jgi:hypothetical protein
MTKDISLGAFLCALGLAGIYLTAQVPTSTFTDDPGPHLFPFFSCAILILCGFGMAITARGREVRGQDSQEPFMTPTEVARSALLIGLLVLYGLSLWLVGFHIATPIMTFAFYACIAGRERLSVLRGAIYTAAVYGALYLLFITFLHSYLPEGQVF